MSTHAGMLDGVTVEVTGADLHEGEALRDASAERLAGMAARRTALRHDCAGRKCMHRNHRRDRYHAEVLTGMLGPGATVLATRSDYDSELGWHSMTAYDADYLRSLGR